MKIGDKIKVIGEGLLNGKIGIICEINTEHNKLSAKFDDIPGRFALSFDKVDRTCA